MPRLPEYTAILKSAGFEQYSNCCPNCHRYPGVPVAPNVVRFPCGSVFNVETGAADKCCESTLMTTENALYEAASMHYMFRELEHQYLYQVDREKKTLPHLNGPPSFLDGTLPVQYLFWTTPVLFSVIDNVAQAVGTIPEWHGDVNMVWVADRDVYELDFMIMGWFLHADKDAVMYGQIVQLRDNTYSEPLVMWHKPFYWGEPIENQEDAAIYLVYSWLHQPYVDMTDGIHYSRPERRRAQRGGQALGNIKVIEFRKPQPTHKPQIDDGETHRELHCCFERTGHSRRQPYGPRSTLRRIQWIAPTLVGDPSKPFKPRGQTLYTVTK